MGRDNVTQQAKAAAPRDLQPPCNRCHLDEGAPFLSTASSHKDKLPDESGKSLKGTHCAESGISLESAPFPEGSTQKTRRLQNAQVYLTKAFSLCRQYPRMVGVLLLLLGLTPTLLSLGALAGDWRYGGKSTYAARQRILAAIAKEPTVLINVTQREMPASPDILNLGKRSTKALERCLSDNVDASLRAGCATMLEAIADPHALPTLQTALDDWDPHVRYCVIRALQKIPHPKSYAPLAKLFKRKDEPVTNKRMILAALGMLSYRPAVQLLRRELKNKPEKDKPDYRPDAFAGLWRSRHLCARSTLVADMAYTLKADNAYLVLKAVEAASELRAPQLVRHLIPLMEHPNTDVRNKAVYALGRIGDKTASRALLAMLPKAREARMLNNIAFALERLDPKAFYAAIPKVLGHKQAVIRLNAAFVLGDVRRKESLPLLSKALEDPSDYVKTSAIVAVGKVGELGGIKLLEPFVKHPNRSIQQEAIYAINRLSGGKHSRLIYEKLFRTSRAKEHPYPTYGAIRRRAAIELGESGDLRVKDFLLACFEAYRCQIDEIAPFVHLHPTPDVKGRLLLAWSRGRTDLTDLIAELHPKAALTMAASAMEVAIASRKPVAASHAIDLVGDLGAQAYQKQLKLQSMLKSTWLRIHSLVALARTGSKVAQTALIHELEVLPAAWQPSLVSVLSRIKEDSIQRELTPLLEKRQSSSDIYMALGAAAIRLNWDPDRVIFRFLDGLSSQNALERDLAEKYLLKGKSERITWLLRRALAREKRPFTRDRLRKLLDVRSSS